jgi:hypothetical protein
VILERTQDASVVCPSAVNTFQTRASTRQGRTIGLVPFSGSSDVAGTWLMIATCTTRPRRLIDRMSCQGVSASFETMRGGPDRIPAAETWPSALPDLPEIFDSSIDMQPWAYVPSKTPPPFSACGPGTHSL